MRSWIIFKNFNSVHKTKINLSHLMFRKVWKA